MSSSQINEVNTTTTLLHLISKDDATLLTINLKFCKGLLVGNIKIPDSPYRHKLQGFDNKGYRFSKVKSEILKPISPPVTLTYATSVPTTSTCPCHNGGTCQSYFRFGRRRLRCVCPEGFRGSLCQDGKINIMQCTHLYSS